MKYIEAIRREYILFQKSYFLGNSSHKMLEGALLSCLRLLALGE